MLTVDYARLGVQAGRPAARPRLRLRTARVPGGAARGRGGGARRRGRRGHATCVDTFGAMLDAGEIDAGDEPGSARSRATPCTCRSPTARFDRVIASEVLEHIPADRAAMAELARVLRPGGTMAVTVPRCGPEFVNWALSDEYHNVPGGPRPDLPARRARRPPRGHRVAGRSGTITPTGCTRRTGGSSAWWGPTNDDPSRRRRLPPAAGLGHREGPDGDPVHRAAAQSVGRQEPGDLSGQARQRVPLPLPPSSAARRPRPVGASGRSHEVGPRGARAS